MKWRLSVFLFVSIASFCYPRNIFLFLGSYSFSKISIWRLNLYGLLFWSLPFFKYYFHILNILILFFGELVIIIGILLLQTSFFLKFIPFHSIVKKIGKKCHIWRTVFPKGYIFEGYNVTNIIFILLFYPLKKSD